MTGMANELNFKQELTAVFGRPVEENPTQVMVEAAYRNHGLDWRYLTIEVAPEDLGVAVAGARGMRFQGFNLTIPHKVAVIEHLDEVGQSARLIGAVNCVVNRAGTLVGENTDGAGFLESVRELCDPAGANVVLIGAGGAARAIAVELALAGVSRIMVANRSADRCTELVRHVATNTPAAASSLEWSSALRVPAGTDMVVNATSIGLYPDVDGIPPLEFSSLSPDTLVADVIPNPPRTRFLDRAAQQGCTTIDGLGMLVNQGRIGVRYWTGIEPDPAVMRAALEQVFEASR